MLWHVPMSHDMIETTLGLVGWWVGRLVGWWVGGLAGRWVRELVGRNFGRPVGWWVRQRAGTLSITPHAASLSLSTSSFAMEPADSRVSTPLGPWAGTY